MRRASTIYAALLAAAACAAPEGDTTADAGEPAADAGTQAQFACDYPTSGYGSSVNKKLEPFVLTNCDGSGDYAFVNQEFCDAKLTVLSIAAGWCEPCKLESGMLKEQIVDKYGDKGVRVLQVLVQDEKYGPPTIEFCKEWVETYGIVNPELLDGEGVIAPYFPTNSLPSTLIIDRTGTIRAREDGVSEGLATLRAKLDQLLAE